MRSFDASWTPAPFRRPSPRLAQQSQPPISGAQIKRTGVGLGLVVTTLSGAAAWVGFRTGLREGGLVSVAGWAVGLTGAILGAMTLFGTASLLLTPAEKLDAAAREAQLPQGPTASSARMPILETM